MLAKKAVCRIILKDPSGKKHLWSATIYEDSNINDVAIVIEMLEKVFG